MYIVSKRITPIWEESSDAYIHQGVFLPIFRIICHVQSLKIQNSSHSSQIIHEMNTS